MAHSSSAPPCESKDYDDFYKVVFDAMPHPVFVVDRDVRIMDCNAAALKITGKTPSTVLRRRGGEALHCIHSVETAEGCGAALACRDCVIRNSVSKTYEDMKGSMRAERMELIQEGGNVEVVYVRVTTLPIIQFRQEQFVLLVLEDISELIDLERIVPVCSGCRKVRNGEEDWQEPEEYFKSKLNIDFSHGFCPGCMERLYPQYAQRVINRQR